MFVITGVVVAGVVVVSAGAASAVKLLRLVVVVVFIFLLFIFGSLAMSQPASFTLSKQESSNKLALEFVQWCQ